MSTAAATVPLSGAQLQAVGALLAGRSLADIARDCNIAPRTLRDWQRQPTFQSALREGQAQLLQQLSLQLATAAAAAIRTLVEVCQDSNQKGSVRVAAANKLLDLAFRHAPQSSSPPESTSTSPAPPAAQTVSLQKLTHRLAELSQASAAPTAPGYQPAPLHARSNPTPLPDHCVREFTRPVHPDTDPLPQARSAVTLLDRITTNPTRRSPR